MECFAERLEELIRQKNIKVADMAKELPKCAVKPPASAVGI